MKTIIHITVGAADRSSRILGPVVALIGLIMLSIVITPRTGTASSDNVSGGAPETGATEQFSEDSAPQPSIDTGFNPPSSPTPAPPCAFGSFGNAGGFQVDADFFSNTNPCGAGGTFDWSGPNAVLLQSGGNSIPGYNAATNSIWIRDDVWCASLVDISTFDGGEKNDQAIDPTSTHWGTTSGSGPQKNDITNVYVHARRDSVTGRQWLVLGAETRATSGDSYVDFEYNQAGITWDQTNHVIHGCTNGGTCVGGRTVGDLLVVTNFSNGGTQPTVEIRTWRAAGAWSDPVPPPAGAVFIVNNSRSVTAVAPGAGYTPDNTCNASNQTAALQFVEAAVDLTGVNLPGLNLCSPMATVNAKSRSSTSFTSDLKDFVLFRFVIAPPVPCDITGPSGPVCPRTTNLQYCAPAGAASYSWSISGNGSIVGSTTGQCVTVTAGSNCNQSFTLTVTTTNSEGCPNRCNKTVPVQDTTLPTITCPPNVTVTCLANVPPANFAGGTASDNCGNPTVTSSDTTTNISPCGSACGGRILRTYRATDACGNFRECTQTITYGTPGTTAGPNQELFTSLLQSGDLVVGVPGKRSLTIPGGISARSSAYCLATKMGTSGLASELPSFGDARLDPATCQTSAPLELQNDGTWRNVGLSQAISLAFNLRVAAQQHKHWARQGKLAKAVQAERSDRDFDLVRFTLTPMIASQGALAGPNGFAQTSEGQLDLGSARTQLAVPASVLRALGRKATAVALLGAANAALAGESRGEVTLWDLTAAMDAVNRSFDFGKRRLIVNPADHGGKHRIMGDSDDHPDNAGRLIVNSREPGR